MKGYFYFVLVLFFLLNDGLLAQDSGSHIISVVRFDPEFDVAKIQFSIYSEISKGKDYGSLSITQRGLLLTGNTIYKNFDIADVLVPVDINYKADIFLNDKLLKTIDTILPIICTGRRIMLTKILLGNTTGEFRVDVIGVHSLVSEEFVKRFQGKLDFIDRYYKISSFIDSIDAIIAKSENISIKEMPVLILDLEDMLDDMEDYSSEVIGFGLEKEDPLGVLSRLSDAIFKVVDILQTLEQRFDHLYINYLDLAKEQLKEGDVKKSGITAGRAFYLNTSYWPAAEFNIHFYNNLVLPEKSDSIMTLYLENTGNVDEPGDEVIIAASAIMDVYFDYIDILMEGHDYIKALAVISNAVQFSGRFSFNSHATNLKEYRTNARRGIINSYGRISRRAMNSGNPRLALQYVSKAGDYLLNEENVGNTDELDKENIEILIEMYTVIGSELLGLGYYTEGMDLLLEAEKMCKDFTGSLCMNAHSESSRGLNLQYDYLLSMAESYINVSDLKTASIKVEEAGRLRVQFAPRITLSSREAQLLRIINIGERDTHVSEMKLALLNNNHALAYEHLAAVCRIEDKYGITPDPFTDSIVNVILKPVIADSMERASFYVWKNQLDEAYAVMGNVKRLGETYNFRNDSLFRMSFDKLNDEIVTKKCFNAESDYEQLLLKANSEVRHKKYLVADRMLESAEKIINNNAELCGLSKIEAHTLRKKIAYPVQYQQLISNIIINIKSGQYLNTQEDYDEAGMFFSKSRLRSVGLKHDNYKGFVLRNGNNSFLIFTVIEFSGQGDTEAALELLHALRNRACESQKTAEAQMVLGAALGKKDKRGGSLTNPKTYTFKYTERDPWYDAFRKAYRKSFRKN